MNTKHGISAAVFLILLTGQLVRAQGPIELPFLRPSRLPESTSALPPMDATPIVQSPQLSTPMPMLSPQAALNPDSWVYQQGTQCLNPDPIGAHGPIGSEAYFRTGINMIAGGGTLAHALRTGWEIGGGGQSIFYSADGFRAWLIDGSVSYIENGGNLNTTFQGRFGPGDNVTIRALNRVVLKVGLGRDWWCCGPGDVGSFFNPNFRYGVSAGGLFGSSQIDLNTPITFGQYERNQKIYGGGYVGIHGDMEIPMGAWTFVSGLSSAASFNSLHIVPGNNTIIDVNLLFYVGIRY